MVLMHCHVDGGLSNGLHVRQEAEKWTAKVKQIDLKKQILDIECPDENRAECAVAIQKILDKHQGPEDS